MPMAILALRTRWLNMTFDHRGWLTVIGLSLLGGPLANAQDAALSGKTEVIERYEQILERAPVEGPSFDKLLQIYQEGDGLEKLDARWAPMSAQPGAKGATYSLLRGLLADRMGKTDAARQDLQAATTAAPDDFHGWLALGDFEVRQGKWADAITALQKGLVTKVAGDDRLSLYRKLGQAQERNLDVPAALATWQKMVEEFPKDQFAVEEAGTSELDAEQFDEAKKTFQKLVDLTEPNSMNRVQALMRLAEVDDRQGKTEAAVHGYEAILPLTAESSWLNRELRAQIEQVYRREDDLAGLAAYYQKWTQDNPKDVEALLLLSATLTELGKKPEALDVLRKVTTLAPDRHEIRQSFAQSLVEAKQYDEAITVLTALTADDPTEPRYWETMGEALWLKTQPPTAESKKAVLDAWSHIAPPDAKDVAEVLVVAELCRQNNLNDEALAGYQRALALSPDASDIREKAVKLLVDLKREDEAWKLLDGMVEGKLATAGNYLVLATLEQKFGRKDAAAEAIQKGLALEPGNFDLLSLEWSRLAEAQKWPEAVGLFERLVAAAPNAYFVDQLEARHLQALTSAGTLDETGKRLRAKLGGDPALTESELRLLLRIMIQQADGDTPKAFDEAHRRFPQSVSLIRLEIDYNRHLGNYDAAVAALQKLVEAVPLQKTDWLGEIVHTRQDQGNLDEALKTAQQIIDASPASAQGYLAYAEIALTAGKADDAIAKLQAAIKLSDKPNEVRIRLARYYLEAGQAAKARTIDDEAFAAAETPQDKLTMVRAMCEAYFQDGQIEELINRFKKEQSSEEGGWRYGLYLSAIYEQMQDFGSARRELAKSLAVRPNDTGLLHSLIGLAEKENDRGELLRYREMLAEADPNATNEIALANEYASQDKPDEAWRIVQKNLGELVKDPMAWKDVLNQITDPDYVAKIKSVLEEAIRSKGNAFEGKFALAQFQMQQGDLDGAKRTLWDLLAMPLPPSPQPPATTKTNPAGFSIFTMYQGPLMQRASQSYLALNEAQQLLSSAQTGNQLGRYNVVRMRMFNRAGVSTTLDPTAIKDHALVYLSVLAVQQKQAENFLKDLQAKFAAWHTPISERLVSYALIQARGPLLDTVEEEANSSTPDKELDQLGFGWCEQFDGEGNDDATKKRAEAARAIFSKRLEQDSVFKRQLVITELTNSLGGENSTAPEVVAKRKAAVEDYFKTMDHKSAEELIMGLGICLQMGVWDRIKPLVDELAALDRSKWSVMATQQIAYLPMGILQQAATTKEVMPKEIIPVMLQLMRLSYPAAPPRPTLPGAATSPYGMASFYNQNTFPPPNRYFPPDRIGNLEPMFQQLKARDMLPAMYLALDQEGKDLNDWRRIYPTLLEVYFQWWDGKKDDSIASVRKLLEQDASDDFRLLLASMLTEQQKYADAIPVLESVTARYGPDYIRTQKELLHVARLAKNNDVGQKAGLRLLALRLPQQDQMQILDDLREVGLKDKADEIVAKQSSRGPGSNANVAYQADQQLRRTLSEAVEKKDETLALNLAHEILNRDPLTISPNGNGRFLRAEALNALKRFGKLDAYIQDLNQQLEASPDSARVNWDLAEAYQHASSDGPAPNRLAPLPQWVKLQRTGNKLEGFYSLDGAKWIAVGEGTIDLPVKLCLGLWVSVEKSGMPVQASIDQIVFTGKTSAATAPATSSAAATNPASTTPLPPATNLVAVPANPSDPNAPPVHPPFPIPLVAPWQQVDVGTVTQPGSATSGASGTDSSLLLTGDLGGASPGNDSFHYAYQMLEGDGSLVARITDLTGSPDSVHESVGIMLRESLDDSCRGASVSLNPRAGAIWQTRDQTPSPWTIRTVDQLPDVRHDAAAKSLALFKKVAALNQKNPALLTQIAEQFRQAKHPNEAADLYATILQADFVTGMGQYYNVLQAFEEANRLPEFVKMIEDWTSPPLNPMGGGRMDMYYVLLNVGNLLREKNHLPEAERVYRKTLTVETFQNKQDVIASLVQVLMDENRRDDAAAEIEKWMLDKTGPAPPPPPILGFNVQNQNQNNWLQSIGWNQNGIVEVPMIHFLELADDLGLSAKLQQEMKAKSDKNTSRPIGQIDPDRTLCLLMAIMARDPSYRPELDKILKENPPASLNQGNNTNAFLILGQQLAKWPQERPMALRLAQTVYSSPGMAQNNFFKNIAGLQVLRISLAMGDHKTAQASLKSIADSIREQRIVNVNQVQLDQVLVIVQGMIQEGMLKDASDLLADCKNDPQLANNYYQEKVDQIQKELAFAKGESSPVVLNYGLTESTGKTKGSMIFWQLNAGEKAQSNSPYFSHTSWRETVSTRPTTYKIEVSGGTDEEHLAHLASYENVATHGVAPIKIPPGVLVVQAKLIRTKPDAPVPLPPGAPAPPPAPATPIALAAPVSIAQILLLGGSENLLENPDFKVSKDSSGKSGIAGWHGLTTAQVGQETGGPLPTGGYATLEGTYNNSSEVSSDPIPLQSGATYVLSGWLRGDGNLGVRFLDADGKKLNQSINGGGDADWQWCAWRLKDNPRWRGTGETIPPKAVSIQIVFRANQDCAVAGLSLRALPEPAADAPVVSRPAPVPPASAPSLAPKPAPTGAPKPNAAN